MLFVEWCGATVYNDPHLVSAKTTWSDMQSWVTTCHEIITYSTMDPWCSRLSRQPYTLQIAGSNPAGFMKFGCRSGHTHLFFLARNAFLRFGTDDEACGLKD